MKQINILKNLFLGCFILIFMLVESKAQNVFNGDVLLETQAEVVAFGANNYTEITGNLEVGGFNSTEITDLSPLLTLISILGDLSISGIDASSLNGLNNITFVGGDLLLVNNLYIINIDELSSISMIGKSIIFEHNQALLNVNGLSGINAVNEQLYLARNRVLTNIDGFSNITSIGDSLYFFDNLLTNLDGLNSLTTVGATCEINRNHYLTNIDGLSNLTSVGEDLILHNNLILASIDGLSNLTSVGRDLQVSQSLVDNFCPLFTLLNGGGFTGSYYVANNAANPTIEEIIAGGPCTTVSVEENFSSPTDFELSQNYPNPFNPITRIRFSIPEASFTTLKVYSILSQEVATLVNENKSSGVYEVSFDGLKLSSGTYFYKLQAGEFTETKKMILLR